MLHYQTIGSPTLELLKKLQRIEEFSKLRLVGGTSLALQIGHRKSIDLDLFGLLRTDELELRDILKTTGNISILEKSKNINIVLIDKIKVDLVNYPYPWLEDAIIKDNITLASKKDIAAMKLEAICGRGTKKDFIDLYFLLNHYRLAEILDFYREKYSDGSEFLVLRSLNYFDDADDEAMPEMLLPVDWNMVKEKIVNCVKEILLH
ncbi:MAG: nucleotidyl transferase AbiEii/AbiGii toxin family protein [Bacteroidales bacterium]